MMVVSTNTKFVLLFLFAFTCIQANAQSAVYPSNGTLYDGKLHQIELQLHPDTLTALLADSTRWSNHTYPAVFIYDQQDTILNVGVRIKGNTSRNSKKLSFKIDIDAFENQTYQGLKTFNLNGNHNDPSMSREVMSAYLMDASENVSIRANPVQLYFNGQLRGMYTHAEQINKKFLSSRFGENTGNLYKCSWPADLGWLGSNQQLYKDIINPSPLNERAYELKTNETADDYTDLVALINTINNTPTASFKQAIDTIFDVQAYLKVLAAEVLMGHWDNYFYNKNNYYLYHHQGTGKFVYLPYDMDNTWGVQWGVPNINVRNVYQWGNTQNSAAPLTNKILAVPQFKKDYEYYLWQLCQEVYTTQNLFGVLDSLKLQLSPAIIVDPYFNNQVPTDYGYTVADWNRSYIETIGNHASFGIKPFIDDRRESALDQIPVSTALTEIAAIDFTLTPNPMFQSCNVVVSTKSILSVYTMQGQLLQTFQLPQGEHQLNLDLQSGLYWVQVEQSQGRAAIKLVVTQ
jgi:spore coat protein CotH